MENKNFVAIEKMLDYEMKKAEKINAHPAEKIDGNGKHHFTMYIAHLEADNRNPLIYPMAKWLEALITNGDAFTIRSDKEKEGAITALLSYPKRNAVISVKIEGGRYQSITVY